MRELHWHRVTKSRAGSASLLPENEHHVHERGDERHEHDRRTGKTYFRDEHRSDGMPVKCEGHPTIEFDDVSDWCYAEGEA